MFLSIMAGVNLNSIERFVNLKTIFFRAMPNLAAGIEKSIGVYSKTPNKKVYKKNNKITFSLGWVYWLKKKSFLIRLLQYQGVDQHIYSYLYR